MPQYRDEDDIDSVLSSIMQDTHPAVPPPATGHYKKSGKKPRKNTQDTTKSNNKHQALKQATPVHNTYMTLGGEPDRPQPTAVRSRAKKYRIKKRVLLAPLAVVLTLGLVFLARLPLSNLLNPSPFSAELKQRTGFGLYYPTNLPNGFKIETNNINQSGTDVVIYVITDDNGKRINITLQKQPANIDLAALYTALSDVRELDTTFGKIKMGNTSEGTTIANILTGQTWIIVNTPQGTISDSDFTALLNSLKQG